MYDDGNGSALYATGKFTLGGDVDLDDFARLDGCYTGPNVGPPSTCCAEADFDSDGDVDPVDFSVYQKCYAGPGQPPAAACDQ